MKFRLFLFVAAIAASLGGCLYSPNSTSEQNFDLDDIFFTQKQIKIYLIPIENTSPPEAKEFDTTTVTLSYSPSDALEKNIVWSISNPNIAEFIDDNDFQRTIVAKRAGSSEITAKAITLEDKQVSASMILVCYFEIVGFWLDSTSVQIAKGQTSQLKAYFSPDIYVDSGVTWISDNANIASVNDFGLVTANDTGSTYIRATPAGVARSGLKDSIKIEIDFAPGDQVDFLGNADMIMNFVPKIKQFPAHPSGDDSVKTAFWIAQTEITKKVWDDVTTWAESNGYSFSDDPTAISDNHPISKISWKEAIIFCNALTEYCNSQVSPTPNYTCYYKKNGDAVIKNPTSFDEDQLVLDENATGFRLPTVSEWNLAAMFIEDKKSDQILLRNNGECTNLYWASGALAGNINAFEKVAWFSSNSQDSCHTVKSRTTNQLGVYDMSGNLWEWCFDEKDETTGDRAMKGGSYQADSTYIAIEFLQSAAPSDTSKTYGLRVVKERK